MWDSCIKDGIATLLCVPIALHAVIEWAMVFSGITAVFFIVFAGIKFMLSGGDPGKVSSARKTMTFAIIGLVLVLMAFFALKVISSVIGIPCSVLGVSC